MQRTGDWGRVRLVIGKLSYEMEKARLTSLRRFALKAEGVAKTHMSKQDLPWFPLKAATLATKARKGQSNRILIATSSYFQAITSYVKDDTAYAGVKRTARNADGDSLADIAKVHEFGSRSRNIKPRPLWKPSYQETLKWHNENNLPTKYLRESLKKYGI